MKHQIAFLHTSPVHIETFSALLHELAPNVKSRHVVNEDLLEDARQNGLTPALQNRIHTAMSAAADTGAKIVVCTCSTIGGIAETAGAGQTFVSMRIDRAMADEAVDIGQRILIVATLSSTLAPTRTLLESSAAKRTRVPQIDVLHINPAWQYFKAGDTIRYTQSIVDNLTAQWHGYDVIVLAQASMAQVAEIASEVKIPILSSPRLGVLAAIQASNKFQPE